MSENEKTAREDLKWLVGQNMETRDRWGYDLHPEDAAELALWEGIAAWPER
ncbi:MAG: hypothetical protein HY508_06345 [Acidobacteria bacterium]|nr:hypothetical protein [Acidobacteriota bacterium]